MLEQNERRISDQETLINGIHEDDAQRMFSIGFVSTIIKSITL